MRGFSLNTASDSRTLHDLDLDAAASAAALPITIVSAADHPRSILAAVAAAASEHESSTSPILNI